MNVYTPYEIIWTVLKIYLKNCFDLILDFDPLIIYFSILDIGCDVNNYNMQEIAVEINSTILTNHDVWNYAPTDDTVYAKICASTYLYHAGIDGISGN